MKCDTEENALNCRIYDHMKCPAYATASLHDATSSRKYTGWARAAGSP